MRQRRWLELVKDYDCEILYHPDKANVVADALSRKVAHSAALITKHGPLLRDFERAEIAVSVGEVTSQLAQLSVQSTLRQRIIVAQLKDPYLVEKRRLVETGQGEVFPISSDEDLMFEGRLCVPEDSAVKTELLTEAHSSPFTMHPGSTKMYQDLRCVYWWRNMKREVADFVSRCLVCQQVKTPRQRPAGLLQPLSVLGWKWESMSMDFITGLPKTLKGYTVIWVVVDRLTKSAHFVPGKSTYTASKWGQLYMTEIVRLHGIPVSIVSDRDARFTSKFWKGLQLALGTRLDFNIAFHPQTEGQTERLNQVLEDMLRACVLEFSGSWDSYLHLMEFSYNNSYQTTIDMAPFEALYGKCCRSLVCWGEVEQTEDYVDVRRKDLEFDVGDIVFLKVAPIKGVLRFEKKGKLSPRFVGPFEILERIGPYVADLTHVVDFGPLQISEDLSFEEQPIEILAREVKKLRNQEISLVKVLWQNHGVEEATWEREEDMEEEETLIAAAYSLLPPSTTATPLHSERPSPRESDSRASASTRNSTRASQATIHRGSEADPPRRSLPNETPVGPRLLRLQVVSKHRLPSPSLSELETQPPDCLSASSGYATDQFVLGVPLGHRRPDFVPTVSHVARVRERASSWVGAEVRVRASWRASRSDRDEP
ncbi:pol protein [Cucumis melo var. makuwa]|uniref:Pol protein n=1 Tax=Cucumis melo var. makuwa TaxID=1194695 RepID=A0A5A7UDI5_CUCMM|nr:pol protein [Cucumis melo var. makuwa]